jgi:hypothetical protein
MFVVLVCCSLFDSHPPYSILSACFCDWSFAFHVRLVVLWSVYPSPSVAVVPEVGVHFVDSSEDVTEIDTHVECSVYPHCYAWIFNS